MIRLALVDVDGTLLHGQSYQHVLTQLWRMGWSRGRLLSLLMANLPRQVLRRFGLVDRLYNQERWALALAGLLQGVPVAEVEALMANCCQTIGPRLRRRVLEEIADRRAEEFRVVLASTAMQPLVTALAAFVGADGGVGTPLAVESGRYTGRLAGAPCNSVHKLRYIRELVGDEIDWAASYAYSDGEPDLPMLERVGNPVMVEPDRRLGARGAARGWRVIM